MALDAEPRLLPLRSEDFGETAERAVAPRAIDVAVGFACDDVDARRGGILAAEVAMMLIKQGSH